MGWSATASRIWSARRWITGCAGREDVRARDARADARKTAALLEGQLSAARAQVAALEAPEPAFALMKRHFGDFPRRRGACCSANSVFQAGGGRGEADAQACRRPRRRGYAGGRREGGRPRRAAGRAGRAARRRRSGARASASAEQTPRRWPPSAPKLPRTTTAITQQNAGGVLSRRCPRRKRRGAGRSRLHVRRRRARSPWNAVPPARPTAAVRGDDEERRVPFSEGILPRRARPASSASSWTSCCAWHRSGDGAHPRGGV